MTPGAVTPGPRLSVAVVEDEPLLRDLIVDALRRKSFDAVGCGTYDAAIDVISSGTFHVACLDVDLHENRNGLDLAMELQSLPNPPAIVFVTMVADPEYFLHGALTKIRGSSYILKSNLRNANQLAQAVMAANAGLFFVDPAVMSQAGSADLNLTPHQLRLLRMSAQGMTNAAIATELGISRSAVESTFTRIGRSLGVEVDATTNLRVACVTAYLSRALRG